MSHAYAARGSRQTAVFTAIAIFHVIIFVVITMGLLPRVLEKVPIPVLEKPDGNLDGFTAEMAVVEPIIDLPRFDAAETVPDASRDTTGEAGNAKGTPAADVEYAAPRL